MVEDITPSPPGNVTPSGSEYSGEPEVDLSSTQIPTVVDQQSIPTAPFDPEPQRERIRGRIALALLAMLAGVLLLAFVSMWVGMNVEVLRTVLTIIFGPLVTLVS